MSERMPVEVAARAAWGKLLDVEPRSLSMEARRSKSWARVSWVDVMVRAEKQAF